MIKAIALFVTTLLAGCVLFSSPPNNQPFSSIRDVRSLEGTYRNKGEAGKMGSTVLLSAVIWPSTDVPHKDIEEIEVKALDERTLVVRARATGRTLLKESTFIEGKDFEIKDGRITIRRKGGIAGFTAGDPVVGPYYENVELGLDAQGQGKYKSDFGVAGLVYMFLPMAMVGSEDVRFVRISKP